jgi:hypothetical protein
MGGLKYIPFEGQWGFRRWLEDLPKIEKSVRKRYD